MRTHLLAAVSVLLAANVAAADVGGVYDAKYEEVATNCQAPLVYQGDKIELKLKGKQVTVDIDRTPLMQGSIAKGGKAISAKSKSGNTKLDGMSGVFSVAGKIVSDDRIELTMVAEYNVGGKPLCTQSWTVVATKGAATPPPPAKKQSTSAADLFLPAIALR